MPRETCSSLITGCVRFRLSVSRANCCERYPGGNLTTSNVAFAGPGMDQLYVTGGEPGALFRLDLRGAKGLVILPARDSKERARANSANSAK